MTDQPEFYFKLFSIFLDEGIKKAINLVTDGSDI